MGALPWVLGLGVAAVGGALYLRARKAGEAAAGGDKPEGGVNVDCDKLGSVPVYGWIASAACKGVKAGDKLLDLIPNQATANARNGKPTRTVDPACWAQLYRDYIGDCRSGCHPLGSPHIEYENKCVPIEGHPGWVNCLPGTKDIIRRNSLPSSSHRALVGTGQPGDILTFKHQTEAELKESLGANSGAARRAYQPFPLPVPAGGTGYYLGGVAKVCTGEYDPVHVRDHTGTGGACSPTAGFPVTPPPTRTDAPPPPPPPRNPGEPCWVPGVGWTSGPACDDPTPPTAPPSGPRSRGGTGFLVGFFEEPNR